MEEKFPEKLVVVEKMRIIAAALNVIFHPKKLRRAIMAQFCILKRVDALLVL